MLGNSHADVSESRKICVLYLCETTKWYLIFVAHNRITLSSKLISLVTRFQSVFKHRNCCTLCHFPFYFVVVLKLHVQSTPEQGIWHLSVHYFWWRIKIFPSDFDIGHWFWPLISVCKYFFLRNQILSTQIGSTK